MYVEYPVMNIRWYDGKWEEATRPEGFQQFAGR